MLSYYLEKLDYKNIPEFLLKYLTVPTLLRLKNVGYFCGMDYASKDVYNFSEYISRYDHSLTVSLLTYKLTKNKKATLAALFHDIATPCFSHVIDYMNGDYEHQESTEEYTERILRKDRLLGEILFSDNISYDDIADFKKYTIVDNERPKLCADRLDGIILTGIGWTKSITEKEIDEIIDNISIFRNEYGESEIGFNSELLAKKVIEISNLIDMYCHSSEDNYMMQLLANIARYAINKKYISYEDLYQYNEIYLFNFFKSLNDNTLNNLIFEFENKKIEDIPKTDIPKIKIRNLSPLANGKRINDSRKI